jgi:hypothetical protein
MRCVKQFMKEYTFSQWGGPSFHPHDIKYQVKGYVKLYWGAGIKETKNLRARAQFIESSWSLAQEPMMEAKQTRDTQQTENLRSLFW